MTQEQRAALKIVEAEVLMEHDEHEYGEFIILDDVTMTRKRNGDLSAIPNGKYVLGYEYQEDGGLEVTLFTDYGFCKSESSFAEVATDGTIEFI